MALQLPTIFLTFLSTVVILASTTAGQPTSDDSDYIRTSCQTTRYPETCFATLSNYSATVQRDPGRLAMVAIHIALQHANHTANYFSNMSRNTDPDNKTDNKTESAALRDCSEVMGDAVDEIRESGKEMRRLGWTGESVRFQLSNVQTWMSAALTNEDTCTDGFEGVADGDVKDEVFGRVAAVVEVTSNALALVNRYADTVTG
ncbi:hypothetical protein SSX86_017545 [Deinandra increscens subsp. villosa]|uniref:Pectinesterase inhibitor domain-containing protein n=1 Tax=Deinandra increscens subsp. villosa TaxID=3103831 RepID=A0AAP0GWV6_9ASTR